VRLDLIAARSLSRHSRGARSASPESIRPDAPVALMDPGSMLRIAPE